MKRPVLLCYNLGGERLRGARMAAMRLKIRCRIVGPQEFGVPLGALCDGLPAPAAQAEPFSDEMLVMAYFPAGMMDVFLQLLRRMGAGGIALKAVLTPVNAAWDGARLREELSREREALRSGAGPAHGEGGE